MCPVHTVKIPDGHRRYSLLVLTLLHTNLSHHHHAIYQQLAAVCRRTAQSQEHTRRVIYPVIGLRQLPVLSHRIQRTTVAKAPCLGRRYLQGRIRCQQFVHRAQTGGKITAAVSQGLQLL